MAKSKVVTERVRVKDLIIGDIVIDEWSGSEKARTGVVTSIKIVPVEKRRPNEKKTAVREVLLTDRKGATFLMGYDGTSSPNEWTTRQCDQATADKQALQEEILGYRIGVRTVLSRCETDIVQWREHRMKYRKPKGELKGLLESYLADYNKIFEQLEALDARMTKDAGKSDTRKPAHPNGRRRN